MREWWFSLFGHPRSCWFCSTPVYSMHGAQVWDQMCETCRIQMKPIGLPGCFVCGRVEKCGDSEVCFDCARVLPTSWVYNRSVVEYTESIKQIVHIFKYKGNEKLADPLGLWMAELFHREFHNKGISLITYVPLSDDRLRQRGFNQAQRLAQRIAKRVKIPLQEVLTRSDSHSSQSKRSRKERLLSMDNAIHLSDQIAQESIQNKGILIVDDVYTTGTTLRACARPLFEGGASRIYGLTFAR